MLDAGAACKIAETFGTSRLAIRIGARIQLNVPCTSQYVSQDQRLIPRKGR